ncbi:MAG: metallophosphoesterase [Acidobacteria bacterium]|nr:metallophosphoesterase [Acidobacteriota bacterium]
MATWAIGDVHGCFRTLEALIGRIGLDVRRDRLWMVGDLVNRGPRSLDVLRWARARDDEMGDRFQVVLGNHDLHLIARYLGIATARQSDTLEEVLRATDGPDLVEWLRLCPFVHFERIGDDDFALVHAGLRPGWSPEDAAAAGRRLERRLRGPGAFDLLGSRNDDTLAAFTRMRMLDADARPHDYNGPPEEAPAHLRPWFDVEPRGCKGHTVVCGHWAALGVRLRPDLIALDSGCVWGNTLTAARLDDRAVVSAK